MPVDENFNYNDINLDWMQDEKVPKVLSPKKCESLLVESGSPPKKCNKTKAGKKRAELAKRIHDTDTLITQIKQLKKDKQKLEEDFGNFQKSANNVQELYTEANENLNTTRRNLQELEENYKTLHNEMIDQKLGYDQLLDLQEKEKSRPLDYDELVIKYLKIIQRLEESQGSLKWQDNRTSDDLKRYCSNKNLKIPASCSPKKLRVKLKMKKLEKSMQCDLWQQEPSKSHFIESKDQATQCQVELRTQGTQHISTMTTRGTSTSCFIKQRHVGTSFPDPKLQPSVEEILSEFGKWDVTPISPFVDSQMDGENKSYNTIGTCTWLCNIRKQIDYLSTRATTRPLSHQLDEAIKQEVSTPMGSPTPTHVRNVHTLQSDLPSTSKAEQNSTNITTQEESFKKSALEYLNTTAFDELWQVFGKMIFSLIQPRNVSMPSTFSNTNLNLINNSSMQVPSFNQQEFHNWLRELYENTRRNCNETNNLGLKKTSRSITTESSSQTFEEEVQSCGKMDYGLLKFGNSISGKHNGQQIIKPLPRCNYQKASCSRNVGQQIEIVNDSCFSSSNLKSLDNSNSTTDEEISHLNLSVEQGQAALSSDIRTSSSKNKFDSLTEKKIMELFPKAKLNKTEQKILKKLLKKSQEPKKTETRWKLKDAALANELNAVDFLTNLPNFALTSDEKSNDEYEGAFNFSPKPIQDDFVFIKPSNKIRRNASNKIKELFGDDTETESDEEVEISNEQHKKELKHTCCKEAKICSGNENNIQEDHLQRRQDSEEIPSTLVSNKIGRKLQSPIKPDGNKQSSNNYRKNYKEREESNGELTVDASKCNRTNSLNFAVNSAESTLLSQPLSMSHGENLSPHMSTSVSKANEDESNEAEELRRETSATNSNHNILAEPLRQEISTKKLQENHLFERFCNESTKMKTFPCKSLDNSEKPIFNDRCEQTDGVEESQKLLTNADKTIDSTNCESKDIASFRDSQDLPIINVNRTLEEDLEMSSEDENEIFTINEKSEQYRPITDKIIYRNFPATLDDNSEIETVGKTKEESLKMLPRGFEMSSSVEDCKADIIEEELHEILTNLSGSKHLVNTILDENSRKNEENIKKKGKNQDADLIPIDNNCNVNEHGKRMSGFDASIANSSSVSNKVANGLKESPESPNFNTFAENELIIDEDYIEIAKERNDSSCSTSSIEEDLNDASILPILDATTCQEMLTDSVCNIVSDILNERCLDADDVSASAKSKKKGRKRKNELELETIVPRKCSARLQAKRLLLENTLNLKSVPVELGKYTTPLKQSNNFRKPTAKRSVKDEAKDLCKKEEIHVQVGFFKEQEKEIITKNNKSEKEIFPKFGFFKEREEEETITKDCKREEIIPPQFGFFKEREEEMLTKHNKRHEKELTLISGFTKDSKGEINAKDNKREEEIPLKFGFLKGREKEMPTKAGTREEEIACSSTLLAKNVSDSNDVSDEAPMEPDDFKKPEEVQYAKTTSFYTAKDSTNISSTSAIDTTFYESPQSPPPLDSSVTCPSTILIPLELNANLRSQISKNKSLIDRLIDCYDQKHFIHINFKSSRKLEKTPDKRVISHLNEYCLSNAFTDSNACELVKRLKNVTSDYKEICSSLIHVAKELPASNVEEKDLPSVIQDMPPSHLSHPLQGFFAVLKHFLNEETEFCNRLIAEIDEILFNCLQNQRISLHGALNLTQLYFLAVSLQENQLDKHPARLFIANCIYYHTLKAIPMILEVLMWYPTVLPPREDRTYDHSDPLITVIKHILMNTKYDMNNKELRGKKLISKLRFEYHFTPFEPKRDDVINNLVEHLKANKADNIDVAFSLLAKRMSPDDTEKRILNSHLLPMANKFYNSVSETKDCDSLVIILLDVISKIVKPFPLRRDIESYLNLFSIFLNLIDRPAIQEAALCAILRLQRFGYVNCYQLIRHYRPMHELNPSTAAMLKTFIYRKPLKFWKTVRFQSKT